MSAQQAVMMKMGLQAGIVAVIAYNLKGVSLGGEGGMEFTADGISKYVLSQFSFQAWLTQEVPAYQQYIKTAMTFYMLFYILQIPKVPIVVCAKNDVMGAVMRNAPILTKKYWPTLWMPSGIIQGWAYHLLATIRSGYQDPASNWEREKLLSRSGHGVTLDALTDEQGRLNDDSPIMLLLNNSMKGSHSYETITFGEQCRAQGYRVYALNMRGAANAELKADKGTKPCFSTTSSTGDLKDALLWLTKRHKNVKLSLVSFGTTSAMVVNYLGAEGKKALVESAVCISPALNMVPLASGSFIQDRLELRVLQRFVLARHADEIQSQLGEEAITKASKAGSVAQFMETVSMQMCGDEPDDEMRYSDYLTAHSTTHLANSIERPVLFIASKDDPIVSFKDCISPELVKQFKSHENAMLCVVRHAGHKCMFESITARNWAAGASVQFIRAIAWVQKQKRHKEVGANPALKELPGGLASNTGGGSAKKRGKN